jgi:hypothetical protein
MVSIMEELDTTLFVSSDETLANTLLKYLNNMAPSSIRSTMLLYQNVSCNTAFQIKTIDNINNLPVSMPNDCTSYPYNYIFPEGLVNISMSLQKDQTYVDTYFPNDTNIISEMRKMFGPNII